MRIINNIEIHHNVEFTPKFKAIPSNFSSPQTTIIADLGRQKPNPTSTYYVRQVLVECTRCLKQRTITFKSNIPYCKSCAATVRKRKHGLTGHKLYSTWTNQKTRCFNPKKEDAIAYKDVTMSKEFLNFEIWLNYVENLDNYEKRELENYTLDRIDGKGNYERGNLRWASKATQAQNTKMHSRNTSGYRGVGYDKTGKNWSAKITVNKVYHYLGGFKTPLEAAKVYDKYVIDNKLEHTLNFKKGIMEGELNEVELSKRAIAISGLGK